MCQRHSYSQGTLVLGSTYLLCGSIQMVAGFLFFLLPTVLHIGSNTWTGLLTVLAGLLFLNLSGRHKVIVMLILHVSIFLINLGNLILMELSEWRTLYKVRHIQTYIQNGHIKLLVAAYLSTVIPTIVVIVVSFLASQYNCIRILARVKQQIMTAKSKNPDSTDQNNFDWVFQEDDWTSHDRTVNEKEFHVGDRTSLIDSEPNIFCLQTFTSPFQGGMPTSFRPSNWSTRLASRHHQQINHTIPIIVTDYVNNDTERVTTQLQCSVDQSHPDEQEQCGENSYANYENVETLLPKTDPPSHVDASRQSHHSKESHKTPICTTVPLRAKRSQVTAPETSIAFSSRLPKAKRSHPIQPLPLIDKDTLVHLSRLELLARQWRFHCQHKSLEKQIALRLSVQQAELSYTNA